MPTIQENYGLMAPSQHKFKEKSEALYKIASTESIGIEIEVENVARLGGAPEGWQVKGDGSLRNNGAEFVSLPISASDAPQALDMLLNKYLNKTASFSPRTSVHVHLDFTRNTMAEVTDFTLMYTVFERLFYSFVGKGRIKNIYCIPIHDTDLVPKLTAHNFRPKDWSKYTGLNLKPLETYGTVEFRHMHGTFDVHKLCVWIDLITKLKAFTLAQGTKKIRSLIAGMGEDFDFEMLLRQVFDETSNVFEIKCEDIQLRKNYMLSKLVISNAWKTLATVRAGLTDQSAFYKTKAL